MSGVLYANTFTEVSIMDVAATHVFGLLRGICSLLGMGYVSVTMVYFSIAKTPDSPNS